MTIGHVNPELAMKLPLDRIAEICQRYGVLEREVHGLGSETDGGPDEETLFLVTFVSEFP